MGARGREAGEVEGGGCAPRAALDGAAAMAAEVEGQHGVEGRGLAEGLRDFFWPYRGAGAGWVTDIVEVSLEAAIYIPWMGDRRAKQNRRRGWLREEFWYT